MKKKKSMFVLGFVFVVLCVLYLAIGQVKEYKKEEKDKLDEKKAKEEEIVVTDIEELQSIAYSYDGEKKFEKEGDTWYYAEDKEFPLNQSYLQTMESLYGNLKASRELSGGDELTDYGLDTPIYTIELKNSNGDITTLYVGNAINDEYYLTLNNKDKVYTVSSSVIDDISYSLNDMIQMDTFPSISSGNLKKVNIIEQGETITYTSKEEEEIATCAGGLRTFAFQGCVDYSATPDELVQYGLDEENRITVEITYADSNDKEQTFTLFVGAEDKDGAYYYVQLDGSKMVNKVDSNTVENAMNKGGKS